MSTSDLFEEDSARALPAGIRVGTAGWTDPTLIKCGRFYPRGTSSAADRLIYYAAQFNVVEVDSSYYHLPAAKNCMAWVERTPPDFRINLKAFAAMTTHPFEASALPPELRSELPEASKERQRLAPEDLPSPIKAEIWQRFTEAISPINEAGKLGYVLLQFPKWFFFSRESLHYLETCRGLLPDMQLAIEFRQSSWFDDRHRQETLKFLREHELVNVAVDEPQGLPNSVPLVAEATTGRLGVLRLHGRKTADWNRPGATVHERFGYKYDKTELKGLVPVAKLLKQQARELHVIFNNCYEDNAAANATQMKELLNEKEAK